MIASTSLLSPQQSRQLVIQDWEPQSSFVQLTCQMSRARSRASARRLHLDVSLQCSAVALLVADLKKGKDIPVSIGDLEAPQPLVYERQLLYERHTVLAELVEERVGVQGVDV